MAERLNELAYAHYNPNTAFPQQAQAMAFNPLSVSLDIRTPEALAAVNEFLVALGRDVAAQPVAPASNANMIFPHQQFFDASGLNQLGLAGMPGINVDDGSLYASLSSFGYAPGSTTDPRAFPVPQIPSPQPQSLYSFDSQSQSSHSSMSTPDITYNQNFIRASRGAPPSATLLPMDFQAATYRNMVSLHAGPAKSAEPEPDVSPSTERILPSKLANLTTSTTGGYSAGSRSLYPLLTKGDKQYKLAPLRSNSLSSDSSDGHSVASSLPGLRDVTEKIEKIGIDEKMEERKRHALLIRDLLLKINTDYRVNQAAPKIEIIESESKMAVVV